MVQSSRHTLALVMDEVDDVGGDGDVRAVKMANYSLLLECPIHSESHLRVGVELMAPKRF